MLPGWVLVGGTVQGVPLCSDWAVCWDFAHTERSSLPHSGTLRAPLTVSKEPFTQCESALRFVALTSITFCADDTQTKRESCHWPRTPVRTSAGEQVCPTMLLNKTFSSTSALRLHWQAGPWPHRGLNIDLEALMSSN